MPLRADETSVPNIGSAIVSGLPSFITTGLPSILSGIVVVVAQSAIFGTLDYWTRGEPASVIAHTTTGTNGFDYWRRAEPIRVARKVG